MIPKCGQVNTKMESKIDVNLKWRFLKNRALAAAGARFFIICGSKLRIKIDRKSIKKRSSRWNALWHRLSFDFGRFRHASLDGKTIKNGCRNHKNLYCFCEEAGAGQEGKEFTHSLVRGIPQAHAQTRKKIRFAFFAVQKNN